VIKAGIAGLGWWGQNLVRAVQGKGTPISFTAGAVRHPDKVAEFASAQGLTLFDSLDAMLDAADIDAVVLATPHSIHAEQIVAAAAAGKHVFCEKPFTMNRADAERAVAAATDAGVQIAVGYNRRFHPAMIELRNRLAAGALGTPLHVEAMAAIPAGLWLGPDDWRFNRVEWPAGGIAPMGVHQIDHMVELFGPIASVYCHAVRRVVAADIDDTTAVLIEFANGMTGFLSTLLAARADNRFAVYGSAGNAEIRPRSYNHLEFTPLEGEAEIIDFGDYDMDTETLKAQLVAFADAVEGRAPFPVSPDQIVHVVAVTDAIIRSAETRKPVQVA
jgi:predicted dehydrogenase